MLSDGCYSTSFVTLPKQSISSVIAAIAKDKYQMSPFFTFVTLEWHSFFVRRFCYFKVPLLQNNFTLFNLHKYNKLYLPK